MSSAALFDLTVDPGQRYNRRADPGTDALRGEMEGRLLGRDRRHEAPRAPSGGRLTD